MIGVPAPYNFASPTILPGMKGKQIYDLLSIYCSPSGECLDKHLQPIKKQNKSHAKSRSMHHIIQKAKHIQQFNHKLKMQKECYS